MAIRIKYKFYFLLLLGAYFFFFFPYTKESFFLPKFYVASFLLTLFWILELITGIKEVAKRGGFNLDFFLPPFLLLYLFCNLFFQRKLTFLHREAFLELSYFFLLFYFFYYLFKNQPSLFEFTEKAVLYSLIIISLYGVIQYLGYDFKIWNSYEGKRRVFSTLGNPNFLSSLLLIAVPYFLYYKKWTLRKRFLILILPFTTLLLAQSFGAWLSVLLFSFLFTIYRLWERKKKGLVILLIITLLASGVFLFLKGEKYTKKSSLLAKVVYKVKFRWFLYQVGWRGLSKNTLCGNGAGDFRCSFPLLLREYNREPPPKNAYFSRRYNYLHSEIMQALFEWGIMGIILFLLWLKFDFIKVVFIYPHLGTLLILFFHSWVSPVFHNPAVYFWVAVVLAYLKSQRGDTNKKVAILPRKKYSKLLSLAVIFLFFLLLILIHFFRVRYLEGMGTLWGQVNNNKMAYYYFNEGFSREKGLYTFPLFLGKVYLREGKFREALTYLNMSLNLKDEAETHLKLGEAYFRAGNLSEAEKHLKILREYNYIPYFTPLYNLLGTIALKKGRYAEAERFYHNALRWAPVEAKGKILFNLGIVYFVRNRLQKGKICFENALKSGNLPANIELYIQKKLDYLKLWGRYRGKIPPQERKLWEKKWQKRK